MQSPSRPRTTRCPSSAPRVHDRALGLGLRIWLEIDHDPIMCFAEFVRSLRIRKENREVPVAAPRMKDR